MTASASRIAVLSIHELMAYPLPNCSAFHARSGSRLWVVSTNGMSYSFFARKPAMDTYQVWVCAMSIPASALIWVRFRDSASRAPLNFSWVPWLISFHGSWPRT